MLLHWGTLEPCGSSNLASVRFSGPVRIRSIRIHPKGSSLFAQNSGAVSQTEPDAFILSIFLNAQAAPSAQEPKPKGTNVLMPTRLAYPGGLREFPLDMGPDFVTRLMVVQGDFARATIAVYGDAVSEPPVVSVTYEPKPISVVSRHRLSAALDPSNSADPSLLSRKLLTLVPDTPSLPLIIRLMCCLKAPDGEWSPAAFPFTNLEECLENDLSGLDWLEKASDTLMTPVNENINIDVLKNFAEKILDALSDKTSDHLYVMAGLLRHVAAQPAIVACTIMESTDLSEILEINLLDKRILDRLRDAATNPIIARALRTTPLLATFQTLRDACSTSPSVKHAMTGLLQRVLGWERFEKTLSAPIPDLAAARWIREIASEEMTFGVFLLSMIEDESLISKLDRFPIQKHPSPLPALWYSTGLASSTEFVAFLRAFIGICCVVAVLCWTDNVANDPCTERIFAILRLWQEVEGYREIVNHLLLIPQLTYRLECVLKNSASSPPSASGIHVEQILVSLFAQPASMTCPELAGLVNALPTSPSSISEDDRLGMAVVSTIAEGGLPEAVRTLLNWSDRPVDTTGARALQTALLILERALEDRETGEWKVMEAAWEDGSHGLVYRLVELFQQIVAPIQGQFLLTPPPPLQPATLAQLLSSSNAAMRILSRLLPAYPLPSRLNRSLAHHIATLFIATDAVDSRYSQGSAVCQAARVARPTCAEALSVLSSIPDGSERGRVGGELVLRTLLHIALFPEGDDPVARMEQVFWLLDLVLPLSMSDASGDRTEQRFWTRKVVPNLLPELQRFLRALAVDHQIQLVQRLAELDRGEVGLSQWFVDEELKYLLSAIESFRAQQPESDRRSIAQARVANSFQFLCGLIKAPLTGGILELFREPRTLQEISRVFVALLEDPGTIPSVVDFACLLAPHAELMEPQTQLDMVVTLLRGAGSLSSALIHARTILPLIGQRPAKETIRVARELGPTLQRLVRDDGSQSYWRQGEALAEAVVSCLSWLVSQPKPETLLLPGITEVSFTKLLDGVTIAAPRSGKLASDLREKFAFTEDVVMAPAREEPGTLAMSTEQLTQFLTPRPTAPSTPRLSGESIFKMATLSPIAALVGSSRSSTLTKTYQNNDFRQLSIRQNTRLRVSSLVLMQLQDFEQGGSPGLSSPIAVRQSPPAPAPLISAEYFQLLPPPPKSESE